ncbi:MAG: CHASE2 domain-containing protein [Spirochaetaceae bacterium]
MARKRSKIFEVKYFGFVIGLLIFGLILLVDNTTVVFDRLDLKMVDVHFQLKNVFRGETIQEGVTRVERNPKISPDILIVGIENSTLSRFGRWPFDRYRWADFLDSLSRISDDTQRERSVVLDAFFNEPSNEAHNDALLETAIERHGRTFVETILTLNPAPANAEQEFFERHDALYRSAGEITNVTGNWQELPLNLGVDPPLKPFARAAHGYGHANFDDDFDEVYRHQALVGKTSRIVETLALRELTPDYTIDEGDFERLAWFDRDGFQHNVPYPLTEENLVTLREAMEARAPAQAIDTDNDGEADDSVYLVRRFKDDFVPAITLALALDYLNVALDEMEVVIGSHILLPTPESYNPETGEWEPYRIMARPATYDDDGNVVTEAVYRDVPEIRIPIDDHARMLINYMGVRSSAARDGHQTFPVRPFAGYAARVPGPDPSTWPPTKALANKIVMVGAFAAGIVDDEKPTPYGLMYGIEMFANSLNTIIMDNFLHEVPTWVNLLVLAALVLLVSFLTARVGTLWSVAVTVLAVIALFFTATILFDAESLMLDFAAPAIAVGMAFIAVVVYRVMTEERDKRRIRDMFGRYVSPTVVDQILDNPPELGGVDKELTVFFSDIRGFTTLSESMTPQELVNHLNVYLTEMTDIIMEYRGTLDKYVGDAIMCFWGAPAPESDHAYLACECSLKQMEALHRLNEQWPEQKRINIGIGLNSGIMTVGNMGSMGRMSYTLTGDNVNVGARLEGTNKMYGTNIIISEHTYGLVKDRIVARELDNIRVKGKNRPVVIYELIDILDGQNGSET